jgi:hypothetical protein
MNDIWQIRHNFISLEFLGSIHERDIAWGRTEGFVPDQLVVTASTLTNPQWLAGLGFYLFAPSGRPFRPLGWMYVVAFVLYLGLQGRGYYMAPAYPMLLAAGSVAAERWFASLRAGPSRLARGATWSALALGRVFSGALMLPLAPINSGWWNLTSEVHDLFVEQIGWPELVEQVASIYAALPAGEQAQAGILTGNYGEAGAIDLYGPAYGLPPAISGINSNWLRGYGDPPPRVVIVVGFRRGRPDQFFETCEVAGQVTNRYSVENEETTMHTDIFVCRDLRQPWPEIGEDFQ